MCDWEKIHMACGHAITRRVKYCHFARNDPRHQCFGVQRIVREWRMNTPCPRCGGPY
ncbi:uncharacterized protein K452DRAFT_231284 [Aplosporella prunicola CBS 121167]|uniref:Uncharacterized protein n=1 Tax=Aplosporella prunicola CBS 121167 TaxID=1176127 RepID=A0A6A6B791_9PEZI|nr:uncharacterized protein K452DRAFT_231284 [Aplosporella prunicola CBS 121167]KAF2140022.1 hypothetical protein K452DRAFT_231284 [Aplosporella prunicola CBS 121167]